MIIFILLSEARGITRGCVQGSMCHVARERRHKSQKKQKNRLLLFLALYCLPCFLCSAPLMTYL